MYAIRFIVTALVVAYVFLVTADAAEKSADAQVNGVIAMRGEPLTGKITFHLDDQFVGAKVNGDGKYKINRLPVGRYKVTVEGKGVPAKFSSEEVSPLTVEVKEGFNTLDFDIQ